MGEGWWVRGDGWGVRGEVWGVRCEVWGVSHPPSSQPSPGGRRGNGERHLFWLGWSWPISRVLSWTVIPLGARLPVNSSNLPAGSTSRLNACLFGLAPDGVYPATPVAGCAVSSYLAISTLPDPLARPSAVYFLWHFPWPHGLRSLTGILLYGARTFLSALARAATV